MPHPTSAWAVLPSNELGVAIGPLRGLPVRTSPGGGQYMREGLSRVPSDAGR